MDELTLGTIMAEISRLSDLSFSGTENVDSDPSESSRPAICGALREIELLAFGMAPVRHHVISPLRYVPLHTDGNSVQRSLIYPQDSECWKKSRTLLVQSQNSSVEVLLHIHPLPN
jgi:hypothetical protein